MNFLSDSANAVLIALIAAFFLLASGQALHAAFLATRRKPGKPPLAAITYEAFLAGHLALACCVACEASTNHGDMLIRLRTLTMAIEPILWVRLGIACLGAALAIFYRKPAMTFEVALLALCTPSVISALGPGAIYLLIADAAFFVFRVSASLLLDVRHLASSVTKLSLIDALDKLPEGIIWTNEKHCILYMNDVMRTRLTALGFATDLSDTSKLWTGLEGLAKLQNMPHSHDNARIELPGKQIVQFKRETVSLRTTTCRLLMATDVTEEESINTGIQRTNSLLEAANRELRESLACAIGAQSDIDVVASLGDAALALDAVETSGATCALLDVCTENDSSGIVAARKIKAARPDVKVIIMTGMPEITFIEQARNAGVDSFVYKNVGTSELLSIIRSTMDGYSTFPLAQQSIFSDAAQLTDTELAILRLVCETKTRKEIAAELYLSEGTVKRHISEILAKTGYDNILRLAVHAVSTGLIVPSMTKGSQEE